MTTHSDAAQIRCDVSLSRGLFKLQVAFHSAGRSLGLFGASGAGKSTLLALLAGTVRPDAGRINVAGRTLVDTSRRIWVPAHRRHVGLVYQDSMLFPHLDVRANLRYGMTSRPAGPGATAITLDDVVGLLGIEPLLSRRPGSLSGGERQRVAIGRALLARPELLLLDEPLASLDYARRQEILAYLLRIQRDWQIPMVYVSHALEEIVRLVDDVVLLRHGRVIDQGAPQALLVPVGLDDHASQVVSVLQARVTSYDEAYAMTELDHPAGRISLPGRVAEPGQMYRMLVRATDVAIAVSRPREISHRTLLRARITRCHTDGGALVQLDLALRGGGRLAALITRRAMDELGIDVGDEVYALAKASAMDSRSYFSGDHGR